MMNILKYISGFLVVLISLASCESNEQPYLSMKDSNLYFDTDQSSFVPSVSENNQTLKVPIILAGIPGTYPVTVTIGIDTTNVDTTSSAIAAKEGVDFSIKRKTITFEEGYGIKYVEIRTLDNTVKNMTKQFDLVISETSIPLKENAANRITVSIQDDEHPLQHLFGTYRAEGLEVFTAKIEKFNFIMSADPTDDATVMLSGFSVAPNIKFKLRVDLANNECTILGGQEFTKDPVYGLVMLCRCYRKEDGFLGYDYDDIPGTISENGTTYTFLHWVGAVIVEEGPNLGAAFFAYKDLKMVKAR